jgi:hypothetical protein
MTWQLAQKEGCSDLARSFGGPSRRKISRRNAAAPPARKRRVFFDVNRAISITSLFRVNPVVGISPGDDKQIIAK